MVLRSHARQHPPDRKRRQDAPVRRDSERTGAVLRHPRRRGQHPGWRAFRADRGERDGVCRRRSRPGGSRPLPGLPLRNGPPPQFRASPRNGHAHRAEDGNHPAEGRRGEGVTTSAGERAAEVIEQVGGFLDAHAQTEHVARKSRATPEYAAERWRASCVAGWEHSDSTPPRLSAQANSLRLEQKRLAACSPPCSRIVTMPPKARICRLAMAWPRWLSRPG